MGAHGLRRKVAGIVERPAVRLHAGLAAVAYLPLLLTRPGWVSADTKTYLYLDPAQLLRRAPSMWDPSVGMGGVTHQRIGFLWPMGPFYRLTESLGIPDWTAQRLWWGSIIFAAGAGVAYLLRVFGWKGPAVTAAVFTYALSPVILTLIARLSGVLLPFAGLPWLVAFAVQSVRRRGWRHPALFALTVATFGSVNATGLLLVGVAPAIWLPYAVWGAREARLRQALAAGLRMGVLTVAVSAWWIAGLNVQRTHGLEIIRYTETAKVVASASVSHEVWRGLGYWFFYGRDRLGPWIEPSYSYTQVAPVLALTYLVPLLGLVGVAVARWRHRTYFVLLTLVGMALAVGAYPWDGNPPFGRLLQDFQSTDAGLAMRSLPRAVPLVALSTAVLLGSGVAALVRRSPHLRRPAAVGAVVLAVLTLPPLWLGQFVPQNLRRREDVPDHWNAAAEHLQSQDDGTRVLVLPGSDFAAYRWGNTVDPVLPGLMDRPSVQRETVPNGSPASANLLNALDLRLQEGTASPGSLAPIARLMRAGELLVVSDWQYERNSLPEPRRLAELVASAGGLGAPTGFRSDRERRQAEMDAPPELSVVPVEGTAPIVSTHAADRPLLVAGDGMGLVDAAAADLIDGTELVRYSAPLSDADVEQALDDGAVLLVTDSNRKRGERWNTLRHTRGHTETATEAPLATDLNDNRLPVFAGADAAADTETDTDTGAQTLVERRGGIEARATSYGNAITYVPEDRPILAVDGDPATAWRVAAFEDARGERLELALDAPVTTDQVRLLQPDGDASRTITRVRLRFDGDSAGAAGAVDVDLGAASHEEPGQTVTFPERTFERLSIEVLADTAGDATSFGDHVGVGFEEVEIGGVANRVDPERDTVRLPTDLLDAAGARSLDHLLAVNLTRLRHDPTDGNGVGEEPTLVRSFSLPAAREFGLTGTARLSSHAPADVIASLLGRPRDGSVPWAGSSDTDMGAVASTAPDVFDGDPTTAWTTAEGSAEDQWVEVHLPAPVAVDELPLRIVADEEHSRPTEVEVTVEGEEVARVDLPAFETSAVEGATADVTVDLPAATTGRTFRVTVRDYDPRVAADAVYGDPIPPVAVAELGLPGPKVPVPPQRFDSGCRDDLLRVGGEPVAVRVTGTTADALAGAPLALAPCDPAAALPLAEGPNRVVSTAGSATGIDVDQLALRSAPGGTASPGSGPLAAEAASAPGNTGDAGSGDTGSGPGEVASDAGSGGAGSGDAGSGSGGGDRPQVQVVGDGPADLRLRVTGARPGEPFWLVLGQSFSTGWSATLADGRAAGPELVDGFANGWRVTPDAEAFDVTLAFTPQRAVDRALGLSAVAALACLLLALRPARRWAPVDGSRSPEEPHPLDLARALRFEGHRPALTTTIGLAAAVGVGSWLLAGPGVGLLMAVVTGLAGRHRSARRFVLAAAPASLALAASYVCLTQLLRNPEPGLDWPFRMRLVHPLGWLAILLVVADVVVSTSWRCARSGRAKLPSNQTTTSRDVSVEGSRQAVLVDTT